MSRYDAEEPDETSSYPFLLNRNDTIILLNALIAKDYLLKKDEIDYGLSTNEYSKNLYDLRTRMTKWYLDCNF